MSDNNQNFPLPWYKEGLRFKCTQCGKCCTGAPGFVWITEEEITRMAASLNMTIQAFKVRYVRRRDNRYALVEKKTAHGEKACIFLKDKRCEVYSSRPKQCRTYPWWKENLNTPESWKIASEACEGISSEAPLISYTEISESL